MPFPRGRRRDTSRGRISMTLINIQTPKREFSSSGEILRSALMHIRRRGVLHYAATGYNGSSIIRGSNFQYATRRTNERYQIGENTSNRTAPEMFEEGLGSGSSIVLTRVGLSRIAGLSDTAYVGRANIETSMTYRGHNKVRSY